VSTTLLPLAVAHALCIVCLLVDAGARAVRLRLLIRSLGGSVGLPHAFFANLVEDSAAALTPMRLGGTPARAIALDRGNVGNTRALLAAAIESAIMAPLVIAVGIAIGVAFAPAWWRSVGPRIGSSAEGAVRWAALALALGLAAWLVMRWLLPDYHHTVRRSLAQAWSDLRRIDTPSAAAAVALTLLSVVARLAILPIPIATLAPRPPLGAVALSSLALLHGQLLLPTPSGAGAIELGFLAGGVGVVGSRAAGLLLAWRLYTTGVAIAGGVLVVLHRVIHVLSGAASAPAAVPSRLSDAEPRRSTE
jgi:uncharacterized membrane protein YbhN (UPF0104 family)